MERLEVTGCFRVTGRLGVMGRLGVRKVLVKEN